MVRLAIAGDRIGGSVPSDAATWLWPPIIDGRDAGTRLVSRAVWRRGHRGR